ncbi:hypothetical protein PoB_002761500 [Plakobranchus ocellatus]|uniref:Uncharacterized protein n=1 Tax=Plakobranchus ocellatus TaxID=259542 RepID=A0AAV4A2G0_9GAST|nr:hypothetical protein PoB_002761500 [Plakobranchus ocellatus]
MTSQAGSYKLCLACAWDRPCLHRQDVQIAAAIRLQWTHAQQASLSVLVQQMCVAHILLRRVTSAHFGEAHSSMDATTRDVFPAGAFMDLAVFLLACHSMRQ